MIIPGEQKKPFLFQILFLVILASLALYFTRPPAFQIRWNDETLYFTVAQNIYFDGDFNSHHYLSESLLKKGYPTKDTHPPGFPLLMALSFLFFGTQELSGYLLNYLLLLSTLLLLFFMGRELKNATTGLAAALLFLLNPLTLSVSQSLMSEISAAWVVTWFFFVLLMLGEGFLKGFLLALSVALATLIKPFLLILLPAALLFLWIRPSEGRWRSLLSLLLSFGLVAAFVVFPLSSNREYYPSSINDLFLQPGLAGKLTYGLKNFTKNFQKTTALGWKSGELAILLLGLGYLLSPLLTFRRERSSWNACYAALGLAFLTSLLAVFFIYEFPAWRGSRAIFPFFPALGLLGAVSFFALPQRSLSLALTAAFCAMNAYYAKGSFALLEASKLRQTAILNQYAIRSAGNLDRLGLQPRVLLSTNNLQIAVLKYPLKVILSEPRSLAEFSKIEGLLPPDVLEINPKGRLFQENLRQFGEDRFTSAYYLVGKGDGFYYYRRP